MTPAFLEASYYVTHNVPADSAKLHECLWASKLTPLMRSKLPR
jgi:hypothetical protein